MYTLRMHFLSRHWHRHVGTYFHLFSDFLLLQRVAVPRWLHRLSRDDRTPSSRCRQLCYYNTLFWRVHVSHAELASVFFCLAYPGVTSSVSAIIITFKNTETAPPGTFFQLSFISRYQRGPFGIKEGQLLLLGASPHTHIVSAPCFASEHTHRVRAIFRQHRVPMSKHPQKPYTRRAYGGGGSAAVVTLDKKERTESLLASPSSLRGRFRLQPRQRRELGQVPLLSVTVRTSTTPPGQQSTRARRRHCR